jgi:hypothetical protein
MPTGFHPHAHLHSLGREITVELLRLLAVLQPTPTFAKVVISDSVSPSAKYSCSVAKLGKRSELSPVAAKKGKNV